ncbi:MAG: MATE family efflux transporter [Clostridia bacterium]|nr:MATE family efflux transporter [Clostridia bacterium]
MKKTERIQLSDHFTCGRLLRFVAPPIMMMIFTSIYSIVDGFFVSNFVGGLPFAALNLIFPFIMILGAFGFMLGTGGTAIVAKELGAGNRERANRIFSMLVYTTAVLGVLLAVLGLALLRPISVWLCAGEKDLSGAEREKLVEYCVLYGSIIIAALPAFMLQNAFQSFFVTAEKPRLGLLVTVIAGCGNILFDAILVPQFGLAGAAIATALNQLVGGAIPILYFSRKNASLLRLGKTKMEWGTLGKVCINGSSELMTNISLSVVSILFNAQLMKFVGYTGVSAYGIINYIAFIFIAIFLGYSIGSSPIVGYNYGAENRKELKSVFKKSLTILAAFAAVMTTVSVAFASPLCAIFSSGDEVLHALATKGMRIYSVSFLVCGFSIFASSFFTALSNGVVSAVISFLRTLVFQILAVSILPVFFGVDGVWASVVVAEGLAFIVSAVFLLANAKRYRYL